MDNQKSALLSPYDSWDTNIMFTWTKNIVTVHTYIYIPKASFVTLILVTRYLGITFPIYARRGEKCSMFVEYQLYLMYIQLYPTIPKPPHTKPSKSWAHHFWRWWWTLHTAGQGPQLGRGWESCLLYFMSNLTKDRAAICNGWVRRVMRLHRPM